MRNQTNLEPVRIALINKESLSEHYLLFARESSSLSLLIKSKLICSATIVSIPLIELWILFGADILSLLEIESKLFRLHRVVGIVSVIRDRLAIVVIGLCVTVDSANSVTNAN